MTNRHDFNSDELHDKRDRTIRVMDPPAIIGQDSSRDLHVVLVAPQIPQNTGNVARLCAATGAWLHLVRPLAFTLDHRKLKRAGLDYWPNVRLSIHDDLEGFLQRCHLPSLFIFSKRAHKSYLEVDYPTQPILLFGQETMGLPSTILERFSKRLVRIPMREHIRSLNLANSVAIGVYEVVRQHAQLFDAEASQPMPDTARDS